MSTEPRRFVCPRCAQRYRSFRTEAEWYRDHLADVCPARSQPVANAGRWSLRIPAAPLGHAKRLVDRIGSDWESFAYLLVGAGCAAAPLLLRPSLPRTGLFLLGVPLLVLAGYRLRGQIDT
jgi:hypothetical protein